MKAPVRPAVAVGLNADQVPALHRPAPFSPDGDLVQGILAGIYTAAPRVSAGRGVHVGTVAELINVDVGINEAPANHVRLDKGEGCCYALTRQTAPKFDYRHGLETIAFISVATPSRLDQGQ